MGLARDAASATEEDVDLHQFQTGLTEPSFQFNRLTLDIHSDANMEFIGQYKYAVYV